MNPLCWKFIDIASLLLDPGEREAVQGDIVESGDGAWQGLRDVLGLVLRRQILLWKNWQPWVAAFGLAMPGVLCLMGLSVSIGSTFQLQSWLIGNYRSIDPKTLQETGLALGPSLFSFFCHLILLIAWAWSGAFVVGTLSRRTLWTSVLVASFPCLFCWSKFHIASLSPLSLFLFVLPAAWGVRQSLRRTRISLGPAIVLAVIVTGFPFVAIDSPGPHLSVLALTWPSWYLVATARKVARRQEAQ